jgi:hypothetical protein
MSKQTETKKLWYAQKFNTSWKNDKQFKGRSKVLIVGDQVFTGKMV